MLHDESFATIPSGEPVKFNAVNLTNNITYDPNTGELTLPETGQYLITWWLNAGRIHNNDNVLDNNAYSLGVELHQKYPYDMLISHSSTHNKLRCNETGTLSGNAIFNANENSTIRFINSSPVNMQLIPNDLYSAAVSITRIN